LQEEALTSQIEEQSLTISSLETSLEQIKKQKEEALAEVEENHERAE